MYGTEWVGGIESLMVKYGCEQAARTMRSHRPRCRQEKRKACSAWQWHHMSTMVSKITSKSAVVQKHFKLTATKTQNVRFTGLLQGEPHLKGEFPSQSAGVETKRDTKLLVSVHGGLCNSTSSDSTLVVPFHYLLTWLGYGWISHCIHS